MHQTGQNYKKNKIHGTKQMDVIYSANEGIGDYKEKWFSHVDIMDNETLAKHTLRYKTKGYKDMGKQFKR